MHPGTSLLLYREKGRTRPLSQSHSCYQGFSHRTSLALCHLTTGAGTAWLDVHVGIPHPFPVLEGWDGGNSPSSTSSDLPDSQEHLLQAFQITVRKQASVLL